MLCCLVYISDLLSAVGNINMKLNSGQLQSVWCTEGGSNTVQQVWDDGEVHILSLPIIQEVALPGTGAALHGLNNPLYPKYIQELSPDL